jgi:hypothetical protein
MTQNSSAISAPAMRPGSESLAPSPPQAATSAARRKPEARFDELSVLLRRGAPNGVRMEIRPSGPVTAANEHVLPLFEGWVPNAELVVRASGICERPFAVGLEVAGSIVGNAVQASVGEGSPRPSFSFEIAVPLRALADLAGKALPLAVVVQPPGHRVALVKLWLAPVAGHGPHIASLDLLESTDSVLFDAPERRLFDLQNPEEGLWMGTGKWRLRLFADWGKTEGEGYAIEARPAQLMHRWQRANDASDLVYEDVTRRAGGRRTYAELILDSSHPDLGAVPQEGKDIPLDLIVEHALTFTFAGRAAEDAPSPSLTGGGAGAAAGSAGSVACVCSWHAALPIRLRDPAPLLKTFQRLSAVGIDFGTTSTVAALYHKGYRSLMRLGSSGSKDAKSAENPTYLLVEDHERLWAEMERTASGARFPNLLRVVRGSHAAYDAMVETPNAVVGELKSLPERVVSLDQSPQLRDRERQRDFLLDEARVRVLVRTYAYLLGRAINRPGQDVYLHYRLTHPAKFDERARKLLEEEIGNGIRLSIPQGIPAEEVSVEMSASEPEAYAAEVCPELAAHPALEPLISQFGEMRFAVFDFGGGTLDVACGRFRPATEVEQQERGSATVIETMQVSGDDHLGGDYLTHELVWLTHQYEKHLPEMEEKEVPMMRPQTIPPNNLANKPHLYKRSLAARQNRVRFDRELGLETVKFGPGYEPKRVDELAAARLDGSEVRLTSLKTDVPGLHAKLADHLGARIKDGVKLMKSMLNVTPWGGQGDWREQGVVILLAGNSSRSEFVERALAEELGIPGLKVWQPDSEGEFAQVVRYETPARMERGANIVGVTPKTAVALGALKIANHEVHLVRRTQGFSYFMGDLRGFPPKFTALIPMGAQAGDPSVFGPHYVEFGRWDAKMPLRVAREYVPGKMTSNDPRLSMVPTGLPAGAVGRLFVCVVTPDEVALCLQRDGQDPLVSTVNLAKFMR